MHNNTTISCVHALNCYLSALLLLLLVFVTRLVCAPFVSKFIRAGTMHTLISSCPGHKQTQLVP